MGIPLVSAEVAVAGKYALALVAFPLAASIRMRIRLKIALPFPQY